MASTYLTRTFGSAGNRKIWTFSAWVKRSKLGTVQDIFGSHISLSGSGVLRMLFEDNDTIGIQAYTTFNQKTVRVFRDTSAWYHIVVSVDTTQATDTNRIKIYVNGIQETSFTGTYVTQNLDTAINNAELHTVGRYALTTSYYLDGSMAHVHFIDGTAYDASAFGETDATTGIWKPKTAPSVTYGTNGFFLKFENSGSMGTDSSGNANNFTVNGTCTQTVDTPSNVFATLNGVFASSSHTLSNGNLTSTCSSADWFYRPTTLGVSQGKYYAEVKQTSGDANLIVGVINLLTNGYSGTGDYIGKQSDGYGYYGYNGEYYNNNSASSGYGSTWTNGDIIGIALDLDNNKLYFAKNGTWQNSGDPTSGATGTGAISISSGTYGFADSVKSSDVGSWNFGNGYFGTSQVASAQSPDDGIGIFEYTVPTGYKALCTKSLNSQEYD